MFIPRSLMLLLFFTVPALAANIPLPDLGSAGDALFKPRQEKRIGQEIYEKYLDSHLVIEDEDLNAYLDTLGRRLARHTRTQHVFHFYLLKDSSINAFASPGAYIAVHSGLIEATDNEAQLVSVIAHEMAHIDRGHIAGSIAEMKNNSWIRFASLAAAGLALSQGQGDSAAAAIISGGALEQQQLLSNIRSHERDADRYGRSIMEQAGYDPNAAQEFLAKLVNNRETLEFLQTHPSAQARIADQQTLKKEKHAQSHNDFEYLLIKNKMRVLSQNRRDELKKSLNNDLKSEDTDVRDAAHYALALMAMRQGQWQTFDQHVQHIKAHHFIIEKMLAQSYLQRGNKEKALQDYEKLWNRYHGDQRLSLPYARVLIMHQRNQEAQNILAAYLENHPQDYQAHLLYTGLLKRPVEKYEQIARYYANRGEKELALKQIEQALQLKNLSSEDRLRLSTLRRRYQ